MSDRPIIATAGMWSTNIGNAFVQLGATHVMSQVAPMRQVHLLSDHAGYWRYGRRRTPRNSARLLDHIDADCIVLSGSLLTYSFPTLWSDSLRVLKERGTRLILLGVGQFDYSERETLLCRQLLREYPPHVFVSRDSQTYENFKDLAVNSYDGIDNAYFLPMAHDAVKLDYPPFVVLNFDKGPEPTCEMLDDDEECVSGRGGYRSCRVPFKSQVIGVRFGKHKRLMADWLGKYYGYVTAVFGLNKARQQRLGEYLLLRTDHQTNPLCHRKLYNGPGAFAMDVPYGYLALYANAALTLTDRIHACVVTMAYGGTAMLFSKSPRARIIERVGADTVLQCPTQLDLTELDRMRRAEIKYLSSVID